VTKVAPAALDAMWSRHHAEWRDVAQIASQWEQAAHTDPGLLRHTVQGAWWETLAELGITLLVTREYEHLVMALTSATDGPLVSFLRLPHPSGLVVDRARHVVYIASTRNPNQLYDLQPAGQALDRLDMHVPSPEGRPLIPLRSRFLPGCAYVHDLALIGNMVYANAVGQNAVIQVHDDGRYQRVWWPRCIDTEAGPVFGQNAIQLNSIAAGPNLTGSFFSASADHISARRPGHRNFPVDRRGVIFSGQTREPMCRGLTRPHSARIFDNQVWVDNSGYGQVGAIVDGRFEARFQLPGWTRGLCFHGQIAFVGTSRVIPRFRHYAPGLDEATTLCGVHALDSKTGQHLGSLLWPQGNQIFAIDWLPQTTSRGFPFCAGRRATGREKALFYAFGDTTLNDDQTIMAGAR
jgi:uncharacterized protein (TIGR03032 family)